MNISNNTPQRPNLDPIKSNSELSKTANVQKNIAAQQQSTVSQTTGKPAVAAPDSTQGKIDIQQPDKLLTPQQIQKASINALNNQKNKQLTIDTPNLLALGGIAKEIIAGGMNQKDQTLLSSKLADIEKENPGATKKALNDALSGKNGLIDKNGNLSPEMQKFAANPRSLLTTVSKPTEKEFSMFTLLLLLDKLSSISYDTYRQMARSEQAQINIQFDKKKSETMSKAIMGLTMGLGSAAISIGTSVMSAKAMAVAKKDAIKLTLEGVKSDKFSPELQQFLNKTTGTDGKLLQPKLTPEMETEAIKFINDPSINGRATNPNITDFQANFAKNYHSAMMTASNVQHQGQAVTQVVNTSKEFMSSMFDVSLINIEKEMNEARFKQDSYKALQQEASKTEARAYDAANNLSSTMAQTMKAIASKIA